MLKELQKNEYINKNETSSALLKILHKKSAIPRKKHQNAMFMGTEILS